MNWYTIILIVVVGSFVLISGHLIFIEVPQELQIREQFCQDYGYEYSEGYCYKIDNVEMMTRTISCSNKKCYFVKEVIDNDSS